MPAAKRGAGSTGPLEAPPQRRFVMVQVDEEQRQSLDKLRAAFKEGRQDLHDALRRLATEPDLFELLEKARKASPKL